MPPHDDVAHSTACVIDFRVGSKTSPTLIGRTPTDPDTSNGTMLAAPQVGHPDTVDTPHKDLQGRRWSPNVRTTPRQGVADAEARSINSATRASVQRASSPPCTTGP